MTTANFIARWLGRIEWFGAAAACLLVEPLALFAGMDGAGAPVKGALIGGLVVIATPIVAAAAFTGAGIYFDRYPKYATVGAVLGLLVAGGLIWFVLWFSYHGPTVPPSIAGGHNLRASTVSAHSPQSSEWSALLANKFPVGSNADYLTDTLREQKFSFYPFFGQYKADHGAFYSWREHGCYYGLTAQWRTDEQQRIKSISGFVTGCATAK